MYGYNNKTLVCFQKQNIYNRNTVNKHPNLEFKILTADKYLNLKIILSMQLINMSGNAKKCNELFYGNEELLLHHFKRVSRSYFINIFIKHLLLLVGKLFIFNGLHHSLSS